MESIGTRLGRLHESIPQDVQTHDYLLRRLKLPAEGSAELFEQRRLSVHCGRAAGVLRALWLATDRCFPQLLSCAVIGWRQADRADLAQQRLPRTLSPMVRVMATA